MKEVTVSFVSGQMSFGIVLSGIVRIARAFLPCIKKNPACLGSCRGPVSESRRFSAEGAGYLLLPGRHMLFMRHQPDEC